MIQTLGLIIWTAIFLGISYISWIKITRHIKVYMLIIYNALYLTGVFLLFPLLKN
jgi:hypothetical protein